MENFLILSIYGVQVKLVTSYYSTIEEVEKRMEEMKKPGLTEPSTSLEPPSAILVQLEGRSTRTIDGRIMSHKASN